MSFENVNIIIIVNIYPGSSTHPKEVFREVLHPIELEFGSDTVSCISRFFSITQYVEYSLNRPFYAWP